MMWKCLKNQFPFYMNKKRIVVAVQLVFPFALGMLLPWWKMKKDLIIRKLTLYFVYGAVSA